MVDGYREKSNLFLTLYKINNLITLHILYKVSFQDLLINITSFIYKYKKQRYCKQKQPGCKKVRSQSEAGYK